jgi:hypothetical protein
VKQVIRRIGIGCGAALAAAGVASFYVAREGLHGFIAFGDDPAAIEWIKKTFQAAIPMFALGALLLGCSLPRLQPCDKQ